MGKPPLPSQEAKKVIDYEDKNGWKRYATAPCWREVANMNHKNQTKNAIAGARFQPRAADQSGSNPTYTAKWVKPER